MLAAHYVHFEFESVANYFDIRCIMFGRNFSDVQIQSYLVKGSDIELRFCDSNCVVSTADIIRPYCRPIRSINYDTKTPAPLLDPPPSLSLEDAADWPCASPSPSPTNRML